MGRIGYGFERSEKEFKDAKIDKLYLDYRGTDRIERGDAIGSAGRPGDVLVLISKGDLGRGAEVKMLEAQIRQRGMTIEIIGEETAEKKSPGRPPTFEATAAQGAKLKKLWRGPWGASYVYLRLIEEAGREDSKENRTWARNWLNNKFGPRGGRK